MKSNTKVKRSKISRKDRLEIIENILVESGAGEDVLLDIAQNRKHTPKEIEQAEMLSLIYRIIHPAGNCENPHAIWEKETEKYLIPQSKPRKSKKK